MFSQEVLSDIPAFSTDGLFFFIKQLTYICFQRKIKQQK